jgi:hypothetical protein
VSVPNLSPLEQIAQTVADWGDGWRFLMDPDSHGRRARLVRDPFDFVVVELELAMDGNERFLHALCRSQTNDGRWWNVSVPVRNPINRKAIEYINAELDALGQASAA